MQYDWVLARYKASSDTGKYALSLIGEGVGYHLINKERQKSDDIIVGFKFPLNKPLPQHLEWASPSQAAKLDDLDKKRIGVSAPRLNVPALQK